MPQVILVRASGAEGHAGLDSPYGYEPVPIGYLRVERGSIGGFDLAHSVAADVRSYSGEQGRALRVVTETLGQ
ncbi:MAG: hypothetical protein K0S37_1879 [Microbacterium sp.]|jgi:hypothetical protein|nr:hypothetical protein [Microbacterium sp.]